MSSKSWRLYTLTNLSITKPIRCITSSSDFEKGQNLFLYVYIVFHEYGVRRILSILKFSLHIFLTLDFGLCMILFPFNNKNITQNIDDIYLHISSISLNVCELVTRIYTYHIWRQNASFEVRYSMIYLLLYISKCRHIFPKKVFWSRKSFDWQRKIRVTNQFSSCQKN